MTINRHLPAIVILCVVIGVTWVAGRVATGDAAHLLGISDRLAWELSSGQIGLFWVNYSSLLAPHPPAGYVLPMFFYSLGLDQIAPIGTGAVAMILIWRGMVLLSDDKTKSPWVALLLVFATPFAWQQIENTTWDLLAAAAVMMSIGHLSASNGLSNRHHTKRFGVWMGIGFLTKYTFPLFMIIPVTLTAFSVVKHRRFLELGIAIGLFLLVASPWYGTHLTGVLPYLFDSLNSDSTMVDGGSFTGSSNTAYYLSVFKDAYGWPTTILILSLGACGLSTPNGRLTFLSAVGGVVILTFMGQQQPRYMFPSLPLLAVGATCGLGCLRGNVLGQKLVSITLIALAIIQGGTTARASSSNQSVPAERAHSHGAWGLSEWGEWPHAAESFQPTSLHPEIWKIDQAIELLASSGATDDATVGIMLEEFGGELGFGIFLQRAEALGHHWNFASIVPSPNNNDRRAQIFTGPFAPSDFGPAQFTLVYAAYRPIDSGRDTWLEYMNAEELQRITLPNEFIGRILRVDVATDREDLGLDGRP